MKNNLLIFYFALFLLGACAKGNTEEEAPFSTVNQQLLKLSELRTEAEKNDDPESFLALYDENAISMPEYQPTLTGIREIGAYYKEIFQRQDIKTFQREAEEVINLGNTIIEIGTFRKEYSDSETDTLLMQNGKYWNVWNIQSDGSLKLKGEAFGFFHHVEDPEALTVAFQNNGTDKPETYLNKKIPFELKAYNALMEKGVRTRNGVLRAEFFTDDAQFWPFAEPTVTGMEEIKPYLMAYSSRGEVTIDSIDCYTFHYEAFEDYVLEYAKFKVKWTVPDFSGRTEGKGIRIWKRQEDKSLKLYREIGMHDHLL